MGLGACFTGAYWSSLRNKSVLCWTGFYTILGVYVCIPYSPLTIEMVELTRRQYKERDERLDLDILSFQCPEVTRKQTRADCEENWIKLLLRPKLIVDSIKRYHCVGRPFFVAIAAQLGLNVYLCVKTSFHKFVTGSDAALAEHYATSYYFPRLFHSYSGSEYLDAELLYCCLYILSFRVSRLYYLIKHSVINRNGYTYVMAQQATFTATTAFRLPLYKWRHFFHLVYSHRRDCAQCAETRRRHRQFDDDIDTAMREKNMFEFNYFQNPINFEQCYRGLEFHCGARDRAFWARDWFVPEPVMIVDPTEYSWILTIALIGLPVLTFIVTFLIFLIIHNELCAIAGLRGQHSCLMQAPWLFTDPIRLIGVLDLLALVFLQLVPQMEGSIFYWDCLVMISRAKKLEDALLGDAEACGAAEASAAGRRDLNRATRMHAQLARSVYQQFLDLRACHTAYLNMLLIGGGFLLGLGVRDVLLGDSLFKVSIVQSFLMSTGSLMGLTMFFCVLTESKLKRLCRACTRLLVAGDDRLQPRVRQYLMTSGRMVARIQDRAFRIAGHYPLTPGTIGPYLAYLLTLIIFTTNNLR